MEVEEPERSTKHLKVLRDVRIPHSHQCGLGRWDIQARYTPKLHLMFRMTGAGCTVVGLRVLLQHGLLSTQNPRG